MQSRLKHSPSLESHESAPSSGALSFVMNGVLLSCALTGTVFSYLTAYGVPADMRILAFCCAAASFLALLLFSLPKWRGWAVSACVLLYAGFCFAFRETLFAGIRSLYAPIANTLFEKIAFGQQVLPPEQVTAEQWSETTTLCLIFATAALSFLLGWAIIKRRSSLLTALFVLPPLLPAFFAQSFPSWPAFVVTIACLITLLMSSLFRTSAPSAALARFQSLALPASIALLALLLVLPPLAEYEQHSWTIATQSNISSFLFDVSSLGRPIAELPPVATPGSTGKISLLGAAPSYTGRTVLKVTCDLPGQMLLHGSSFARYTGSSWESLEQSAYDEIAAGNTLSLPDGNHPFFFPALPKTDASTFSITVNNWIAPRDYVYAPYGLSPSSSLQNDSFFLDRYLLPSGMGRTHTMQFLPTTSVSNTKKLIAHPLRGEAAEAEMRYREFVYENYLEIPDGFLDSISPWTKSIGIFDVLTSWFPSVDASTGNLIYQGTSENGGEHLVYVLPAPVTDSKQPTFAISSVHELAALLAQSTTYDAKAPRTPIDEDYVSYFLNESRTGYCMHYASAVVLLLRARQYPARYASGFSITVPDSGEVEVPDSSAHAWIEIYLNGYGWYPVDVTPASTGDGEDISSSNPEDENPAQEPQAEDDNPAQEPLPEEPAPLEEDPSGWGLSPSNDSSGGRRFVSLSLFLTALGIALLLLACFTRRALCRFRRKKRLAAPSPNQAVSAAYAYLQRLLPWGAEDDAQIKELAQKAHFSPHVLLPEERDTVLTYVLAQSKTVDQALPILRRFAFRYFYGLF